LQAATDMLRGEVDWSLYLVDSTIVRSHQYAAEAGRREAECLSRSRGSFGTELHLRCDRAGKPIVVLLTPG
jgi:hypothetical protein